MKIERTKIQEAQRQFITIYLCTDEFMDNPLRVVSLYIPCWPLWNNIQVKD